MAIKSLEKTNLRKKLKGFFSWTQQIDILQVDTKCHIFTLGAQNLVRCVKTQKIVEGISQPAEDAKSWFFFYSKELRLENDLKF